MTIMRAQISVPVDTGLPKDLAVCVPHFEQSVNPLPNQLADELAIAMQTYLRSTATMVQVKVYDAENPGTKDDPHPPIGQKTRGVDPLLTSFPRELALCLSYYADDNVKRKRGRLYLPFSWVYKSQATSPTPPALRPHANDQIAVLAFATMLKTLGGTGTDWVVWSRMDSEARTVTNYYVDDEWDIQRRRGGRPTGRASGTGG